MQIYILFGHQIILNIWPIGIGRGGKLEAYIIDFKENVESSILGNYLNVKCASHESYFGE